LKELPAGGVRLFSQPLHSSIFRFDQDLLLAPHFFGSALDASPLIRARRTTANTLFEAVAEHFELAWGLGRDVSPPRRPRGRLRETTAPIPTALPQLALPLALDEVVRG
jgi:hypothetical protein